MNHYHKRLEEIKNLGSIDFMKIKFDDANVSLRPVDESDETIKLLTEWRNKYWDGFYEKFTTTEERTRKWVRKQIIENPERILFLIILNGEKIGHYGANRYDEKTNLAELDNAIRGVRKSHPGLIVKVEMALLQWMFDDLKLSKVRARIWSDNYKALDLHAQTGCRIVGNVPFKRTRTGDDLRYEEIQLKSEMEFADRYELIVETTPERFYALFGNKKHYY